MPDLRIDAHVAARLLDEAVDHAQPEAGALADVLGGEERLEGARDARPAACRSRCRRPRPSRTRRPCISGMAAACSSSSSALAVSMVSRPPSGMASRALTARLSTAFSSWLGSTVGGHRSCACSELDLDVLAERALHQRLHVGEQLADVGRTRLEHLAPAEGEQPARQVGAALGGHAASPRRAGAACRRASWRARRR